MSRGKDDVCLRSLFLYINMYVYVYIYIFSVGYHLRIFEIVFGSPLYPCDYAVFFGLSLSELRKI